MFEPDSDDRRWRKSLWTQWSPPPVSSDADLESWRRRLDASFRRVLSNELDTRRFLASEVYHVADEWLDELLRVRLADLRSDGTDDASTR